MNSSTHRLRQARFQQERLPARNERARGHVMRGWGGWLSVILLTAGCGGRSAHTSVDPGDERSGSNDGGTPGSDSGAGGAGAASDAGAPDMPYQSLIRSGTRRCENEDYCFGLSCYAPPGFAPTVCLASCQSDASCGPSEACLSAPELEPACYARCKSPEDCYYGFGCFDFSGEGELVCFPAPWIANRDSLGY